MTKALLEKKIVTILKSSSPLKARQVVKILANDISLHVDRSEVNSILYSLKSQGDAFINDHFEWSLADVTPISVNSVSTEPRHQTTVEFTSDQEAIIQMDNSDHLLIRGQAGSGKTTVLAARAGRLLSTLKNGSILFLTYNSALCTYVRKCFEKEGVSTGIEVKTFHEWAKSTSEKIGCKYSGWVNSKKRAEILETLIDEASAEIGKNRLYKIKEAPNLINWWGEEIAWMFGQHLTRLQDYLEILRTGRGNAIRVSTDDKRFIWFVYESYIEYLEENNVEDYDNPAGLILRSLMTTSSELPENCRCDHLLIDEVQDFDKSWLMAAMKTPRYSLTLAGDTAQKIYKRGFTWASVGIKVRGGRSKYLAASHRTTKQIMNVANELLIKANSEAREDNADAILPSRNGSKVRRIQATNPREAYDAGYDFIANEFKTLRVKSIAVVFPFSKQLYAAEKSLKVRKVKAEVLKGQKLGSMITGIALTTYHQLKGLEFDHVVIMGLHDAQYPSRLLTNIDEEDLAEEEALIRRILYVGMTRAKETVTLVGSTPFCRYFNAIPGDYFDEIPS